MNFTVAYRQVTFTIDSMLFAAPYEHVSLLCDIKIPSLKARSDLCNSLHKMQ